MCFWDFYRMKITIPCLVFQSSYNDNHWLLRSFWSSITAKLSSMTFPWGTIFILHLIFYPFSKDKDEFGKHLCSNHSSLLKMAGVSPHYFAHIPMHVVPRHLFMYHVGKDSTRKKKHPRNLIICPKTCEGDTAVCSLEPNTSRNKSGCKLAGDFKKEYRLSF